MYLNTRNLKYKFNLKLNVQYKNFLYLQNDEIFYDKFDE